MSLFDLKQMISVEDFADAHEPLNDGVKEVPNAQTVAAGVKTAPVGKSPTSQGEAKVVPEKPDTDDQTNTEHTTVKESAERSDKPVTAKAESDSGNDTETKSDVDDVSADDDSVLEHDSEKSVKDDLEKTEKATTALEAYAPKAKRLDIIGHPKVQAERIGKAIQYLNRKAGITEPVTVSAESIEHAIMVGHQRKAQLERTLVALGKSAIANENLVEEIQVTEQPTEHGAPPMDPVAAAALTEIETDPLDVPLLEIEQVQETIGVLEQGAAAIEQYREIIRSNPKMSKQAAAVLHAGLEHIDQMCELKVRSTGLESYVTTPRAAMEEADVNERSLSDRARDIGAKIINFIMTLIEKIEVFTLKYSEGINKQQQSVKELLEKARTLQEGIKETTLNNVPRSMFLDKEFVGDRPTEVEMEVPTMISSNRKEVMNKLFRPMLAILARGPASQEMVDALEDLRANSGMDRNVELELPGGFTLVGEGVKVSVRTNYNADNRPVDHTCDEMSRNELVANLQKIDKYLDTLNDTSTALEMTSAGSKLKSAIVTLRGRSKGGDESVFQKVQTQVTELIGNAFHPRIYFATLGKLAQIQAMRLNYYRQRMGEPVSG